MNAQALDEIIQNRRTIKPPFMSQEEVSEADLAAILENANWAPSHALTEPWRFRIFRGEGRARLANALAEHYETALPPEQQKPGKAEKLREMPLRAPVVILVWMARQEMEKIAEVEEIEAVACSVQNMHLTATSRGLGAFWSTPPVLYTEAWNQWMEIGAKDRCLGIFYIGYPADPTSWPKGRRRSVDSKVEWVNE